MDATAAAPSSEAKAGNMSAQAWRRALELTAPIGRDPHLTLPVLIGQLGERFGERPALLSDGETISYRTLAERCERYACWAEQQGIGLGDVVCLLMANCPDYVAIWLGITRVGGIVALLNTNLVGASLLHSIAAAGARHLIVGADLAGAVSELLPRLPALQCWAYGAGDHGFARLDLAIETAAGRRPAHGGPRLADPALYIYTSGTTGLPKAARVSHFRIMQWSHWFAGMMGLGPDDRLYNCLPMYHSVGGVVATGAALVAGASVVIRKRFSARRFWDEIADWHCTVFQYIGELCRYLADAPPHPGEGRHRLRLACGNGLRADVWERFRDRFRVPQIIEFYAATEGNFSLYNCDGKPGAIGRIPPFLAHRFPVALVRIDPATEQPLRDDNGFCLRCAPDEPGEAIGRIGDDQVGPGGRFEGYTDRDASGRKVLHDVFKPGDAWYRTGDLMRRDRAGYFYFVDRLGDTFRWKGENVSTLEVSDAVAAAPGVVDAVVYGVEVPGRDGRAGMAAIVTDERFDVARFGQHLAERLPDYAVPVFLRLPGEIALTATFKPQKQRLAAEGFDPGAIADALYVHDPGQGGFVLLDTDQYRRILSGELRL